MDRDTYNSKSEKIMLEILSSCEREGLIDTYSAEPITKSDLHRVVAYTCKLLSKYSDLVSEALFND